MNRIQFFKIILLTTLFLIAGESVRGELLRPNAGGDEKEILVIGSKRRLYYAINNDGLTYTLNGPRRLELISRLPVNSKRKKTHGFQYTIIVDQVDTIAISHKYYVDKRIRSVQRPNKYITYSGNYFINIPAGKHEIRVIPSEQQTVPVLVRVLGKEFTATNDKKTVLTPTAHQAARHLITEEKKIEYYELSNSIPLQIAATGPGVLKITSRLEFESWMGPEEVYRLKVSQGKKIIGTYYFTSERSTNSIILEETEKVPAKWRSCEIKIPDGKYIYDISLTEKDRVVLTRFTEYK